jgi:hypothetical protein
MDSDYCETCTFFHACKHVEELKMILTGVNINEELKNFFKKYDSDFDQSVFKMFYALRKNCK